jgi:hypothetical protein
LVPIRHHRHDLGFSKLPVRDQEVEGSNPFAPTTSKTLPFNGLRYFFNFTFHSSFCTNVDQFKAEPDPLGAFLTELGVIVERRRPVTLRSIVILC